MNDDDMEIFQATGRMQAMESSTLLPKWVVYALVYGVLL
jgi:hypothetical protein